ncbi:CGL156 [Auxenochlorella protothecoides x Auxenochlorella symbiontica]
MAGTRPPSLRAVILRSGQGVEEVIGGERQGLGALEELMHVSEGEIEIHVFKAPQLQDLPEYLAAKKPNMLYISGGVYHGGDSRAHAPLLRLPFMHGPDGHPQPAAVELFLRALTGLNLFAVYIDAAGCEDLGRRIRSRGIPHVVTWANHPLPRALPAMHFAHAFFAHLRTPSVSVAEAFGLASHALRAHAFAPGGEPPLLPLLLAAGSPCLPGPGSLPPLPLPPGADPAAPHPTTLPEYGAVRVLAPHAEARLLLAAHPALVAPAALGLVCEALRGLLTVEARRATLAGVARLERAPPHLPPGSVALRVQLLSASRAPLTVVVAGPPRVLEDGALLAHALRAALVADAHSLQLKLPPAGAPPPPTRASPTVAAGTPVVEALAVASVWMVALLKGLCQDKQYRGLMSVGVAAVSVTGVAAFEPTDAARWTAVLGSVAPRAPLATPGRAPAGPGLGSPPSHLASDTPLGPGLLGPPRGTPASVAGGAPLGPIEAAQQLAAARRVAAAAAAAAAGGSAPLRPADAHPAAGANGAARPATSSRATSGGENDDDDEVEEDEEDEDVLAEGDGDDLDEDEEGDSGAGEDDDNGEGVELPPPLDPLPGQESADSEATQPSGDGQAGGVEVVPWRSQRGPLKTCTEAEFYADLSAFLKERKVRRRCAAGLCAVGTGLRGLAPGCNALHHAPASCGGASRTGLADVATMGRTSGFFPVLNALQLDLFNLYKEVCQRGGFALGNGINWKGQVFPAMRNFTQDHRLTGVGNALKRHYQVCLLDYEQANPDDVTSGNCLVCGQGAGDDWISCDNCDRWLHFSCDKRPHPGSFKDYSKRHGLKFVCGPCTDGMESDAAQPSSAGKPSGPSGPNGTAQDHGATSSPQSHPGTNLASASRTGSTYLPSADVPQLGPQ